MNWYFNTFIQWKIKKDHEMLTWPTFEHTFPIKYGDLHSIPYFNDKPIIVSLEEQLLFATNFST